jgi:hypothetical protein
VDAANAADRREQLLASLDAEPFDAQYEKADPQVWNKLSLRPLTVSKAYLSWPKLVDLAAEEPPNGLMEKRGGDLIDHEKDALAHRMETYFDGALDWDAYKLASSALAKDAARFNARAARQRAINEGTFDYNRIVRYIVRPFDVRFAYYTEIRPIWNECRPELWTHYSGDNKFIMSRPSGVAEPEGVPIHFTRCLGDNDAQRGHSYYMPFRNRTTGHGLLPATSKANLSTAARNYLKGVGFPDPDNDKGASETLWLHSLAVAHSPAYLAENKDGISIDWPRVPLPAKKPLLETSAALGEAVAAFLDTEKHVVGVTAGNIREHLQKMAVISGNELSITVGWGSRDRLGRVSGGQGRLDARSWTKDELAALRKGLQAAKLDVARSIELLGPPVDVYLNDNTCWRGVPQTVWDYFIGGYPVIKKWLSYREENILGRPLTPAEAREVTAIVRRIATIVLMTDALNENYRVCRDDTYSWPVTNTANPISAALRDRLEAP